MSIFCAEGEAKSTLPRAVVEREVDMCRGLAPGLHAMWATSYFATQRRRHRDTSAMRWRKGEEWRQRGQGKAVESSSVTVAITKRPEELETRTNAAWWCHPGRACAHAIPSLPPHQWLAWLSKSVA